MTAPQIARTILTITLTTASVPAIMAMSPSWSQPPSQPVAVDPTGAPAPKERVAAIKKSFADSQAALHKYEWIETTITSLRGEEKARKQSRCYYGAEGKVQKIPLAAPSEESPGRGVRGRIKERKKEELADYMEEAASLVHKYLPPDHEKVQKCADSGNTSIRVIEPERRASIEFRDYLQPGDLLSIEIDMTNNTILRAAVATALGADKDPVSLEVRFDKFSDGTIYTAEIVLEAKAKNVKVDVQNGGYTRTGP